MRQKKKILFLHSKLTGYFIACIKNLVQNHPVEVHIVKYPFNKAETSFQFPAFDNIIIYDRKKYTREQLQKLSKKIKPDIISCSGWVDKTYLNICKKFNDDIPTILAMDNQWKGTIKQQIAVLTSRFYLHNKFSHVWVPGKYQYEYASRLGFKKNNILTNLYSADIDYFNQLYLKYHKNKQVDFPKRFLFVGRYLNIKGLQDLWSVFEELQKISTNKWELWCIGKGELERVFPKNKQIKNFGFIQPNKLNAFIKDTGVFILPTSIYENWSVATHEFAAAGFPLICSNEVGAATAFLQNGYNGYLFKAGDKESLKKVLQKMMQHNTEELIQMGKRSHTLAQHINPDIWTNTIWQLIK